MTNEGIEFQFSFNAIKYNDLRWDIDANITSFRNEITKLPQKEIISGTKKLSVGKSIYDYWLRDYAGVDPEDGQAMYYYDELDAAGKATGKKLTTKDRNKASFYYVGSSIPDFFGGITNTFSYKGVTLSVLLSYSVGGKMYDYAYAALMHPGTYGNAMHTDIEKRWQKKGDITNVPRLENGNTNATAQSSRFLTDASYIALKNVSLTYDIPNRFTQKIGVNGAKVFVVGDNLKIFGKRQGMDPSQSFTGDSDYTYVPTSLISFGLNIQL